MEWKLEAELENKNDCQFSLLLELAMIYFFKLLNQCGPRFVRVVKVQPALSWICDNSPPSKCSIENVTVHLGLAKLHV